MVPKLSRHIVTSQYLPVPGPLSGLASPDVHRFVLLLPSWLLLQHHFLKAAFTDHPKIILQYLFSLLFSYIFFFQRTYHYLTMCYVLNGLSGFYSAQDYYFSLHQNFNFMRIFCFMSLMFSSPTPRKIRGE